MSSARRAEIVAEAAKHGSHSAAARALGISHQRVSEAVGIERAMKGFDVSTTGTTESADTSTGGSTGNDTMLGDACAPDGAYLCDGSGPGVVGQLLECKQGEWDTTACDLTDCPALGFPQYQVVGCSGEEIFGCICQADPGTNCIPADQGCDVDGMTMTLCLDGVLSKTVCAVCYEDPNGPYCGE